MFNDEWSVSYVKFVRFYSCCIFTAENNIDIVGCCTILDFSLNV